MARFKNDIRRKEICRASKKKSRHGKNEIYVNGQLVGHILKFYHKPYWVIYAKAAFTSLNTTELFTSFFRALTYIDENY